MPTWDGFLLPVLQVLKDGGRRSRPATYRTGSPSTWDSRRTSGVRYSTQVSCAFGTVSVGLFRHSPGRGRSPAHAAGHTQSRMLGGACLPSTRIASTRFTFGKSLLIATMFLYGVQTRLTWRRARSPSGVLILIPSNRSTQVSHVSAQ